MSRRFRSALMGCTLLLAGCGDSMEEMQARVTEIKQRPGGRIEPLPEIKPYETFAYSLDTLRMVGTLRLGGRNYGLVQTKDGLVHRVLPGNHLGQNDGRITAIEEGKISLIEIVPDGMGGFIERPAALALSE